MNEFMKSSFLPKYEPNIVICKDFCPVLCHTTGQIYWPLVQVLVRARILKIRTRLFQTRAE